MVESGWILCSGDELCVCCGAVAVVYELVLAADGLVVFHFATAKL